MKNSDMRSRAAKKRPKELTRAELEIMRILWRKGSATVHAILDEMPEPKPAYNTVSTIVRILERKKFAGHTPQGKTHEYFPIVGREEYTESYMNSVLGNFFDGSLAQMVSFFARREEVSPEEFDRIIEMLEKAGGTKK